MPDAALNRLELLSRFEEMKANKYFKRSSNILFSKTNKSLDP